MRAGPPVASHEAGYVLVDKARLMFADPTVLGTWRSDTSIDGLADLVFWGRDAEAIARDVGADPLLGMDGCDTSPGQYGWLDRSAGELFSIAQELQARRDDPSTRFALDFRPHDDHHRLLSIARRSPTESGTIDLAGTPVTGFFTTWGDGAFPVYRDLLADGTLARIRVELG